MAITIPHKNATYLYVKSKIVLHSSYLFALHNKTRVNILEDFESFSSYDKNLQFFIPARDLFKAEWL